MCQRLLLVDEPHLDQPFDTGVVPAQAVKEFTLLSVNAAIPHIEKKGPLLPRADPRRRAAGVQPPQRCHRRLDGLFQPLFLLAVRLSQLLEPDFRGDLSVGGSPHTVGDRQPGKRPFQVERSLHRVEKELVADQQTVFVVFPHFPCVGIDVALHSVTSSSMRRESPIRLPGAISSGLLGSILTPSR